MLPHEADGRARLGELVRHALQVQRGPRLRSRLVPRPGPHYNTHRSALKENTHIIRTKNREEPC